MKIIHWQSPLFALFALGVMSLFGMSCSSVGRSPAAAPQKEYKDYHSKAYRPQDPSKVRVKISLQNQAVYVLEGDRPLLVTVCSVGKPESATPKGQFTIRRKERNRRRLSQPGAGYPMGFWCEFKSAAYGIHAGWLHLEPRTLGCVRLHYNVAPKFFELVRPGTPLHIADTQPEDATLGRNLERPSAAGHPEFPPEILMTNRVFDLYQGPIFED